MDVYQSISTDSLLEYCWEVRQQIRECLKVTPEHLLSWAPKEGMQSFGILFIHISTSVDWWLTTVFKDGGQWIPASHHRLDDKESLDNHLEFSFERLEHFIGSADLSQMYISKEEALRGAWIILHLFEHDIQHLAQIKVYLRQNGITPPGSK